MAAKRGALSDLLLNIPLKIGRCRWCGCTERDPCPAGCAWYDRPGTLCTSCAPFDKQIRTEKGRQDIARRWQGAELPP